MSSHCDPAPGSQVSIAPSHTQPPREEVLLKLSVQPQKRRHSDNFDAPASPVPTETEEIDYQGIIESMSLAELDLFCHSPPPALIADQGLYRLHRFETTPPETNRDSDQELPSHHATQSDVRAMSAGDSSLPSVPKLLRARIDQSAGMMLPHAELEEIVMAQLNLANPQVLVSLLSW